MATSFAGLTLDVPRIMGIVNVTPDSFPMAVRLLSLKRRLRTASPWQNRARISSTSAVNQPAQVLILFQPKSKLIALCR